MWPARLVADCGAGFIGFVGWGGCGAWVKGRGDGSGGVGRRRVGRCCG